MSGIKQLDIQKYTKYIKCTMRDFSGDPEVKNLPCNAGDVGLIPGILGNVRQLRPHKLRGK